MFPICSKCPANSTECDGVNIVRCIMANYIVVNASGKFC